MHVETDRIKHRAETRLVLDNQATGSINLNPCTHTYTAGIVTAEMTEMTGCNLDKSLSAMSWSSIYLIPLLRMLQLFNFLI